MQRLKDFFNRVYVIPFQCMFAIWSIYSGITGLLHFGVVSTSLTAIFSPLATTIFNAVYILAGLAMLLGPGLAKRNLEAMGLMLVSTVIGIRALAVVWFAGHSVIPDAKSTEIEVIINTISVTLVFLAACFLRIHSLWKLSSIVMVKEPVVVVEESNGLHGTD